MRIAHSEDEVGAAPGRVVTIGAFDGVHLGHRALLRLVRELAAARGLPAAVVTFDRHPAEVIRPEVAPPILTSIDHKLELLGATGDVDDCLVLAFDKRRSEETAEHFVEQVLSRTLRSRVVVVGADFHFGYRRRGNVLLLQQMGADLGFEVLGLGLVATPDGREAADDAVPYSSTRIRQLLAEGRVDDAAALLGRDHDVAGTVSRTAEDDAGAVLVDLDVDPRICLPARGLYAGHLLVQDREAAAAITVPASPRDAAAPASMRLVTSELAPGSPTPVARVAFRTRLREGPGSDSSFDDPARLAAALAEATAVVSEA